jgi:hypothetical protein
MSFMNIEHQTSNAEHRMRGWLRVTCFFGVLAAGVFACLAKGNAQGTNGASGPNYDSFKIIRQRNIFDPNRSGRTPFEQRTRVRQPVVDSFALVGTMSYSKGKFAFFDGSAFQFKKVLEPGGNIAGYTVKDITPNAVTLAANGKEFGMKVGAQLRNEGASGWKLSTYSGQPAVTESDGGDSAPTVESTAPPTGSNPEMSERLRIMMENRKKELQ